MTAFRPVLSPALPVLRRVDGSTQLGRTARDAMIVDGAGRLLALLDGTRTREQVLRDAPAEAAVLDALEQAGLVLDVDDLAAPSLERDERERLAPDVASLSLVHGRGAAAALLARRSARIVVHGAGRVGAPLAALLTSAGVGAVDVHDDQPTRLADTGVGGLGAADVGRRRGEAIAARLSVPRSPRHPDLVVLTDEPAAGVAEALRRSGTPHLRAVVEERTGTVGPLVLPGTSCLSCQALTHQVLDPDWATTRAERHRSTPACDGVLAMAVAAQATLQVLELLEGGRPATVDGSLELTLPGWAWRRRSWPRHPGCLCQWDISAQLSSGAA